MEWTPEAEAKLKDIPFFVRPFARKKIETYTQDHSLYLITIEIYEQVKQKFNEKYD
ncbi:PCP reductase family protein [Trichormus azollae]|uniref:PCP reductase family protein n=1 Tax=Trichormus azollae TaxID=1164 RepID=UPI00325F636A